MDNTRLKPIAFLTGANGFLGSFIAKTLLLNGYRVRALLRKNADTRLLNDILDELECLEGDVLDVTILKEAMQGAQVVVHAAAVVSMAPQRYAQMMQINVTGTANMVNMALEVGIKHFIHISSVAAIGNPSTSQSAINETEPLGSAVAGSVYAQSKYLAEREVWRGMEEGLSAVILNPAYILGFGNWHKSSVQVFHYIAEAKSFYPPGALNYVDVRDVAQAVFLVLKQGIQKERFILCAGMRPHREVFAEIAQRFDVKAPHRALSPTLAKIAIFFEAIKCRLTGAEPRITKDIVASASNQTPYAGQKATHKLGLTYHSLEETLDWACAAYKNPGFLHQNLG